MTVHEVIKAFARGGISKCKNYPHVKNESEIKEAAKDV